MIQSVFQRNTISDRTVAVARSVLAGRRPGLRGYLAFAGPAVVASIAYMDPGNFATNIQAGAKYGYELLWVVLLANAIAMLFQGLSAKLGIVTGQNLAEMCRAQFRRPVVLVMWVVSEIAAMATDLAEFLGGAIGLSLLFGLPLLAGMAVTAAVVYGVLMFDRFGFRPIELIIGNLVAVIGLCYLIEMFVAPVDWPSAALHSVVPHIADVGSAAARGRHRRRHRHAARRLSAFGPDAGAHPGPQRRRDPDGAAHLQYRGRPRARGRRPRQHGDGHDGVERLPCRPQRGRGDRDRLSHLDAAARRRRRRACSWSRCSRPAYRARRSERWPAR